MSSEFIPAELFQTQKDGDVKVLHSICQQIWKTQHWPQDWKMSIFISIPKKGNAKECSNYWTIALISYAKQGHSQNPPSQALAVHELRIFRYTSWIQKWQRKQRSNGQHSLDHRKSKRIVRKTSTSVSLTILKLLTLWFTANCGKFFNRCEYQTTLPASQETCMQIKK